MKKTSFIKFSLTSIMFFSLHHSWADTTTLIGDYEFQKCTVDVTNSTGLDISDIYQNFNNPFAFYTDPKYPGVTLPGPSRQTHCKWTINKPKQGNVAFTWNSKEEQCILNGAYGYFNPEKSSCSTGETSIMSKANRIKWSDAAKTGKIIYLNDIPGTTEKTPVMIGVGHGVLNSKCGGVALVKNTDTQGTTHYAAILEVGTRAWSFEISQPTNTYLANDNVGGTCYIPEVTLLSPDDVQLILNQLRT